MKYSRKKRRYDNVLAEIHDIHDSFTEEEYYDALYYILGDSYPDASDEELEEIFEEMLENMSEQQAEDFMSSLGSIGKKIGSGLAQVPNFLGKNPELLSTIGGIAGNLILPGAGGMIGGALGSAAGGLMQNKNAQNNLQQRQQQNPNAIVNPDAAKLNSMMQDPQMQRALMQMSTSNVPIAPLTSNGQTTHVPIANFLHALIRQAQAALQQLDALIPPQMQEALAENFGEDFVGEDLGEALLEEVRANGGFEGKKITSKFYQIPEAKMPLSTLQGIFPTTMKEFGMIRDTMPTAFQKYIVPDFIDDGTGTGTKILRINPVEVMLGYQAFKIETDIQNYLTANAADLTSLSVDAARLVAIREGLKPAQKVCLHLYQMAVLSTIPIYVEICRKHRKTYTPTSAELAKHYPLKPGQYYVKTLQMDNSDEIQVALDKAGAIPTAIWSEYPFPKRELALTFNRFETPYPWVGDHEYIGKDGDSAHTCVLGSSPFSLSEIHISVSDAIEKNVSYLALLQMFAHEFYGHAYLYLFPRSVYYGAHLEEGKGVERADKNIHFVQLASVHQKSIFHYESQKTNPAYFIPLDFQI